MSSSSRVTDIDVGTPPYPQEWENIRVHFHNFKAEMKKQSNGVSNYIESQKFDCCGTKWYIDIRVMPDLNDDSSDSEDSDNDNDAESDDITITLWKVGGLINLDYKAIIKDLDGRNILNLQSNMLFNKYPNSYGKNVMYKRPPIKLSYLIDPSNNILVDGTLTIELSMKVHNPKPSTLPCKPFIPTNPINTLMPSMFNDEETADVIFEVRLEEKPSDTSTRKSKKAKISPVRFYAHRCILKLCAPNLADLCESSDKLSPIPISNVKPNIFHHLLHYTYGGKVPINELKQHAKDIINASDMYGITNLKLEAEVWYTKCLTLSPENVMEELHYAESKNLALLKEMVMDYLVENSTQIINKVSSLDNAPESSSLLRDLLTAISMQSSTSSDTAAEGSTSSGNDDSNQKYRTMRVSALRRILHDRGLGVDGSREVLVAALEKSDQVEDGKVSAE